LIKLLYRREALKMYMYRHLHTKNTKINYCRSGISREIELHAIFLCVTKSRTDTQMDHFRGGGIKTSQEIRTNV